MVQDGFDYLIDLGIHQGLCLHACKCASLLVYALSKLFSTFH